MDYEQTLLISILFVFSMFLFPEMNAAIGNVSMSEPLQPLLHTIPIAWLGTLLVLLAYSVVNHK